MERIQQSWITKENIENSSMVSNWAKKAFKELDSRDVCDALDDLEMLKIYFDNKFEELMR